MPQKSFAATQRPASSFVPKASISSAVALAALFLAPAASAIAQQPESPVLLDAMTAELHRAFSSLGRLPSGKPDGDQQQPPYFLSYSVSDASYVGIRAQYGALVESTANRIRVADVQVRLGDPKRVAALRKAAARSAADPDGLTSQLFVRRNGAWEVLP